MTEPEKPIFPGWHKTEPETTSDIETVTACVEGAARLGVEPFIDAPAAWSRIQSELQEARETIADVRAANQKIEHARAAWAAEAARLREALRLATEEGNDLAGETARLREENDRLTRERNTMYRPAAMVDQLREENERLDKIAEAAVWVVTPNGSPHRTQKDAIHALDGVLRNALQPQTEKEPKR